MFITLVKILVLTFLVKNIFKYNNVILFKVSPTYKKHSYLIEINL
jgi:hypothetical protein